MHKHSQASVCAALVVLASIAASASITSASASDTRSSVEASASDSQGSASGVSVAAVAAVAASDTHKRIYVKGHECIPLFLLVIDDLYSNLIGWYRALKTCQLVDLGICDVTRC